MPIPALSDIVKDGVSAFDVGGGGGGNVNKGEIQVDFGAFPGTLHTTVSVGVPTVNAATAVTVFVKPKATADHSTDEHLTDPPRLAAVVEAGVGFTIHAFAREDNITHTAHKAYGAWTVGYLWS